MQVQKSPITVGNRGVGEVWVDGGTVRGEGGSLHPQLVVPLTIAMHPQPAESQIMLAWVRVGLSASDQAQPPTFACPTTTESLIDGFQARSLPSPYEHTIDLRLFMTQPEVAALEAQRQALPSDPFMLHLRVDGVAAGLVTHNQIHPGQVPDESPWDLRHGMYSQVLPFWNTRIHPVRFAVEESRWVRGVLPGLGHDRLRLLEIAFPPALPDHRSAASEWDKARRAFDERRYGDCVSECRDLLAMWEKQLGATKSNRVASMIADRTGWPAEDLRRGFIDGLWKATNDLVNVPHHPEGRPTEQHFDRDDARLMLVVTAALSEYVSGH
jgi:hypothetical protein